MRNAFLSPRAKSDIDKIVQKILRDLGNPEPPLQLEPVRDLLMLDKGYYSPDDPGVMGELVHRLKVAGKQIVKRPMLLFDAIKSFNLKALFLPDKRRIMLDSTVPTVKQRWYEAHEISHSVIPWHDAVMLGDTVQTLSPACHEQIESEANYAAGQLLFFGARFSEELLASNRNISGIKAVAKSYGNTITSTLWRMVESSDLPVVGTIGGHPRFPTSDFIPSDPFRYMIRSRLFEAQFGNVTEIRLLSAIETYCSYRKRGPLGSSEVVLTDDNGAQQVFEFESFSNGYETLTLGVHKSARRVVVPANVSRVMF
jgi:hypothetical protein